MNTGKLFESLQGARERMFIDIAVRNGLRGYSADMLMPDDRTDGEKRREAEEETERLNSEVGHKDKRVYDCPICCNRGEYYEVKRYVGNITEYYPERVECGCVNIRKELERLLADGTRIPFDKYTFERFAHTEPWQEQMYTKARNFLAQKDKFMFYAAGQPGCGKTHICTAVLVDCMRKTKGCRYMVWVDVVQKLKRLIGNDERYTSVLNTYKNAPVLYIDDFLKPVRNRDGSMVVAIEADLKIAFEIINYRYINSLITIFSSENHFPELESIDEAIASRIYESAGEDFIVNVGRGDDRNVRYRAEG